MPEDEKTPTRTTRPGKRMPTNRTGGAKSKQPQDADLKPAARKTWGSKAPQPPPDPEVPVVAERQAREALEPVQKRCDELAAVAEAERRISDLHRQLGELGDIGRIRREVETLKAQVEASAQRAAEVDDFVAETNRTLTRVLEQEAAARKGIEAVKRAAETLDKMVHEAQANSGECKHQAAQSREELDAVGLRWQELQKEFGIVEAATRAVMNDLQRALQEAREELNRREPEPERHDAVGAAVVASLDPPNVEVVPADELAPEAQDRLVRYLNDAASVERELAGLLQMLADASDDPVLRTEFEQHRKLGEEQRGAYEARVRALGGEPVGDRRMLGQLVARLWEALEKPRTTPDRVETLLKALSATEMDAGIWLAVHALAGAVGDTETLALAATRHRQEREFADWIRERLTWIAHGAARRR